MKGFKKLCSSIISVILCLAMLSQIIIAEEPEIKKLYVKEIKLIYAKNVGDAESQLPEGFKLYRTNLNYDTGRTQVYMCYSTTEDPDEAITDIRVMHEDGGYEVTDFGKTLDNAVDGVYGIAAKEFAENYKAGKREAQIAYRQLNYYYVEVNKVKTYMGDYMLNFPEKNDGFAEILFKGNPIILDNIRNLLAMGVSDGGALIDRIKAAVNDESVYGKKEYWEDAKVLVNKTIQLKKIHNENYDRITEIMNDTTLTEEERESALAMPRYNYTLVSAFEEALKQINTKDGGNYSEYFNKGTITDYSILYPFIEAMTPGQKAMALSGQLHSVLSYNIIEMTDAEIEAELTQLEATFEELPVTLGTDMDLIEGTLGVTSDAIREEAATGNGWFACFTGNMAADIVISALFGAGGATLIGLAGRYLSKQMDHGYLAQLIADRNAYLGKTVAKDAQTTSTVNSAELSTAGQIFATVGMIIGICLVIFSVISIKEIVNKYKIEYTDIPANMVDVVSTINGNRYVNYKVVNSLYKDGNEIKERAGDTNAYNGSQWNAIYYTKSYEAGKCMTANAYIIENASDFGKYTPAAKFGSNICYNLNSYNGNENTEAIYFAFSNSNNKKTAETSLPTVVGSMFSYSVVAVSAIAGVIVGMGVMALIKRKKETT